MPKTGHSARIKAIWEDNGSRQISWFLWCCVEDYTYQRFFNQWLATWEN